MKKLLSLIVLILSSAAMWAQTAGTDVRGEVCTADGKAIERGEVTLLQSDTIAAAAMTDAKGKFEIRDLPAGDYVCQVSAYGYKDKVEAINVKGARLRLPRIVLQRDSVAMLDELTVTADHRLRTKEMAGMSIYYLSDRAKKELNAYMALREIPRLIVNTADRTISLDNGTSPPHSSERSQKDAGCAESGIHRVGRGDRQSVRTLQGGCRCRLGAQHKAEEGGHKTVSLQQYRRGLLTHGCQFHQFKRIVRDRNCHFLTLYQRRIHAVQKATE